MEEFYLKISAACEVLSNRVQQEEYDMKFENNELSFIRSLTNRAKVAYFLAVAEDVWRDLPSDLPGRPFVRNALNASWRWVEGYEVFGDDLYALLENEDGTGVMLFAGMDTEREPQWSVITIALAYTIWRAYIQVGAIYLPQTVEGFNDDVVLELHASATRARVDQCLLTRLQDYFSQRFHFAATDELGQPIEKDEITRFMSHP